jgi:hypothetical protein
MEEQQGTSPLQGQDRMVAGEPGGVELKRQRSQCEAGEVRKHVVAGCEC